MFYNAEISFVKEGIDQRMFFSVILSNYIALFLTAVTVAKITDYELKGRSLMAPLLAGSLCFLSFGTSVYVLTGLVEGWTWFLIAIGYYAFRKQHLYLLGLVLLASVLQKEIISIIFGVMSFVYLAFDWRKNRKIDNKAYLYSFGFSLFAFACYIIVRKFIFPAAGYENQLEAGSLIVNLIDFLTVKLFDPKFFVMSFLSQNLLYIFAGVCLFHRFIIRQRKAALPEKLNNFESIAAVMSAWLVLCLIGMASGIGTNLGRVLIVFAPIFAVYIGIYLHQIEGYFTTN